MADPGILRGGPTTHSGQFVFEINKRWGGGGGGGGFGPPRHPPGSAPGLTIERTYHSKQLAQKLINGKAVKHILGFYFSGLNHLQLFHSLRCFVAESYC